MMRFGLLVLLSKVQLRLNFCFWCERKIRLIKHVGQLIVEVIAVRCYETLILCFHFIGSSQHMHMWENTPNVDTDGHPKSSLIV